MLASAPRRPVRAWPLAAVLGLGLVTLAGCQSYETGIEVICQAPVRCVECREAPPELRSMKYAEYMERLVRNGKAQEFLGSVATMDPQARIAALRSEAKTANLTECPLADFFEEAEFAAAASRAGGTAGPQPTPPLIHPATGGVPEAVDTDGTGDTGDTDDTGGSEDETGAGETGTTDGEAAEAE